MRRDVVLLSEKTYGFLASRGAITRRCLELTRTIPVAVACVHNANCFFDTWSYIEIVIKGAYYGEERPI
jgi:hypothetical protein